MAAISAGRAGARVVAVEANTSPGRKLLLTGGGRCNLTHRASPQELVRAFGAGGRFISYSVYRFSPQGVQDFFARQGLRLKLEDNVRLLGYVEDEKLPVLYNAADLTIVPSYSEGGPLITPESLACGTPVYIYNVARREEKISQKVRFTIPLRNVFVISPSPSVLCKFLSENRSKIHQMRNDKALIKESREYILRNHAQNEVLKSDIMRLLYSE